MTRLFPKIEIALMDGDSLHFLFFIFLELGLSETVRPTSIRYVACDTNACP